MNLIDAKILNDRNTYLIFLFMNTMIMMFFYLVMFTIWIMEH